MALSTDVTINVLGVPRMVAVLNRLAAAVRLLGDIEQDSHVPAYHRQRIRVWRDDEQAIVDARGLPTRATGGLLDRPA